MHSDGVQCVRLQVLDSELGLLGSDSQLLQRGGVLCSDEEAITGDSGLWGGPRHQNRVFCNLWEVQVCRRVGS